jgi:hypothetical protein
VLKSTWDENPWALSAGEMIYQYKNNPNNKLMQVQLNIIQAITSILQKWW